MFIQVGRNFLLIWTAFVDDSVAIRKDRNLIVGATRESNDFRAIRIADMDKLRFDTGRAYRLHDSDAKRTVSKLVDFQPGSHWSKLVGCFKSIHNKFWH